MTICTTDRSHIPMTSAPIGTTVRTPQLQLGPQPRSVNEGRRWAVDRARELGASTDAIDVIELLTCELVTNAVKYGPPAGLITVTAERHGDLLDVAVSDDGLETPVMREPLPGDVSGRGLPLVEALSLQWGVELHPGHGKSVWFQLSV